MLKFQYIFCGCELLEERFKNSLLGLIKMCIYYIWPGLLLYFIVFVVLFVFMETLKRKLVYSGNRMRFKWCEVRLDVQLTKAYGLYSMLGLRAFFK